MHLNTASTVYYYTLLLKQATLDRHDSPCKDSLGLDIRMSHKISHCINSLRWRQNGRDSVSNHQPHDCLLNRLFRSRSKKTSKLRVTGLCAGNSPGTGEFPAQMASYAENVSIWWRHHVLNLFLCSTTGAVTLTTFPFKYLTDGVIYSIQNITKH